MRAPYPTISLLSCSRWLFQYELAVARLSCVLSVCASADHVAALLLPQFQYELAVARMVLADDADELGGLLANSSGWLGASDETHCGKMATLKVRCCWLCCLLVKKPALLSVVRR